MKVLVIQQKMIGDVLTSSILFEAIKIKYPDAQLHYLINSHTYPVVEGNPYIDKFQFFTPEHEKSKLKLLSFAKQIKKEKYDVVIDVYGKLSSNIISYFSKSPIRISYHKNYNSFIYTDTLKRKTKSEYGISLAIENRIRLLEFIDIKFKDISPKIYLIGREINDAKDYLTGKDLNLKKPIYMISVLGSSPKKTYPFSYMAKVLDNIAKENINAQILFNYIPKQEEDAKAIYDLCKTDTQGQIYFNVFGKSLREFLGITAHCTALIGNEGGAVNMAKALDIPTFTIFNPALNKQNWFGTSETKKHVAVHLSDYVDMSGFDKKSIKDDIFNVYKKFKPEYFRLELIKFLRGRKK
ncbi:glycosyltransferase family 9 protein [Winogradskyella haliclonae]|uniref:Heptosyltransferase n=1 Tax=Winogradskyella haliclonae TaxID=2048558 RepID=A0ABQ2BXA1_9FLAO|nr:glycosyltransferase family 9 protein [Winogradskyella haliclonae]GGI57131.1 heptosyltransferase [Winogradskyella haliclonae]